MIYARALGDIKAKEGTKLGKGEALVLFEIQGELVPSRELVPVFNVFGAIIKDGSVLILDREGDEKNDWHIIGVDIF